MKRLRSTIAMMCCVIIGIAIGFLIEHPKAQAQTGEQWEVLHGNFGQQSFYAMKFNRSTGEVWVLSAERGLAKDTTWVKLPEENRNPRK